MFLKGLTPAPEEPQEGPSGGVPKGDTVIPGAGSSVGVTDPEDPPAEQDGGGRQ